MRIVVPQNNAMGIRREGSSSARRQQRQKGFHSSLGQTFGHLLVEAPLLPNKRAPPPHPIQRFGGGRWWWGQRALQFPNSSSFHSCSVLFRPRFWSSLEWPLEEGHSEALQLLNLPMPFSSFDSTPLTHVSSNQMRLGLLNVLRQFYFTTKKKRQFTI